MNRNHIKIYLIDIDGVLTKDICWTKEECLNARPNQKMIDQVNELSKSNYIIAYTTRRDEMIPNTLKWLRKHDIHFEAISNTKTNSDFIIDDHNIII